MTKELVYSIGDVAKACGVTVTTIIEWIDRGLIPGPSYRTMGRGDRIFTEEDLNKAIVYAQSRGKENE